MKSMEEERKKVFVRGSIIIIAKEYDARGMVCLANESYSKDAEIIDGDLVIDDSDIAKHTVYYATGGISQLANWEIPKDINEILAIYEHSIRELEQLLSLEIKDNTICFTRFKYVFVGVFAAMEAFLCDVCRSYIPKSKKYISNYMNTIDAFNRKIKMSEIICEYSKINETIDEQIRSTMYHNLEKVKSIFEKTFEIKFPDINKIKAFVDDRHNIVHRNGRTFDGKPIFIDLTRLKLLMSEVDLLVKTIAKLFESI